MWQLDGTRPGHTKIGSLLSTSHQAWGVDAGSGMHAIHSLRIPMQGRT
jgi:hypothetical protein